MSNRNGISRGDRNRSARPARLRALVSVSNAIVGIDLADAKQMVVVTDHDSKVLAHLTLMTGRTISHGRTFRTRYSRFSILVSPRQTDLLRAAGLNSL